MSMDQVVTTPPPNYGWVGSSESNSWSVKPKSAKSEHAWVDNNWLNPNGANNLVGFVGGSSKSSKSHESIAHPSSNYIQSAKSGKAMYISDGQSDIVMVSKSAKSHYDMSMGDQEIIKVTNGIKMTSKTGKGSYLNDGGQASWASKSAKSMPMSYFNDTNTSSGIKLTSKTGKASYYMHNGQVMMISKSAKSHYVMSVDDQDVVPDITDGVKVMSKTGKASYYSSNGQVVIASKSAKSTYPMSYSQQEIANAKTSKSGKAYYTTNGQTIWVSKSAKSNLPMSYSYHEESAVGKVKLAKSSKTLHSKSSKADMNYNNMSMGHYSKSAKGIYYANMSVSYYSKSAKSSHTYMSMNPSFIITSKSAKSHGDAHSRDQGSNRAEVKTKTGKSSQLLSIEYSEHAIMGSKSSKGSKSTSNMSLNYSEESGEIWAAKSAKSTSSKSSKSSIEETIIITPEEAGLPFRAKSSKSIPLRHIHNNK